MKVENWETKRRRYCVIHFNLFTFTQQLVLCHFICAHCMCMFAFIQNWCVRMVWYDGRGKCRVRERVRNRREGEWKYPFVHICSWRFFLPSVCVLWTHHIPFPPVSFQPLSLTSCLFHSCVSLILFHSFLFTDWKRRMNNKRSERGGRLNQTEKRERGVRGKRIKWWSHSRIIYFILKTITPLIPS